MEELASMPMELDKAFIRYVSDEKFNNFFNNLGIKIAGTQLIKINSSSASPNQVIKLFVYKKKKLFGKELLLSFICYRAFKDDIIFYPKYYAIHSEEKKLEENKNQLESLFETDGFSMKQIEKRLVESGAELYPEEKTNLGKNSKKKIKLIFLKNGKNTVGLKFGEISYFGRDEKALLAFGKKDGEDRYGVYQITNEHVSEEILDRISRVHFKLSFGYGKVYIEDLKSTNGITIIRNDKKIVLGNQTKSFYELLEKGDKISISGIEIIFIYDIFD